MRTQLAEIDYLTISVLPQRRDMDDPDQVEAVEGGGDSAKALVAGSRALNSVADESGKVLAARPDGLVREVIGKQVISREEINELTETEERKALGDFSDEVSDLPPLFSLLRTGR